MASQLRHERLNPVASKRGTLLFRPYQNKTCEKVIPLKDKKQQLGITMDTAPMHFGVCRYTIIESIKVSVANSKNVATP